MTVAVARNKQYLTDLFAGPFPGHAIVMDPESIENPGPGDITCGGVPTAKWIDWWLRTYEAKVARHEQLDDDAVPYVKASTGTQIFAAAFGCPVETPADSPPFALPLVTTAAEAERLAEPTLDHPIFEAIFEFARRMADKLGPDVPIAVPDIQSPFDGAALVWRKQDLLMALYDEPEAVKHLVDKCGRLIVALIERWLAEMPEPNLCHCPTLWTPPQLGASLSEDEAGAMSPEAFAEFCLPWLNQISRRFGGLFMHCCATADHQYDNFQRIENLRGLNRMFQQPGPGPAIRAFSGRTVLVQAWTAEDQLNHMLDLARPDTRFVFNLPGQPLEEAKATYDRLRQRCPRACC